RQFQPRFAVNPQSHSSPVAAAFGGTIQSRGGIGLVQTRLPGRGGFSGGRNASMRIVETSRVAAGRPLAGFRSEPIGFGSAPRGPRAFSFRLGARRLAHGSNELAGVELASGFGRWQGIRA